MTAKRNVAPIKENPYSYLTTFILLNAGEGTRIKSFGNKCLLKLKNSESLLERQIRIIRKNFAKAEIILITGFECDRVLNKVEPGIIKIENENYENNNIAKSINLGLRAATTDKVYVIYGDLVFSENVFQHHTLKSSIIVDQSGLMTSNVGCNIHEHYAELLMYDNPNIWSQIAFLTGKELRIAQNLLSNRINYKMFGFEILNEIINKNGKLFCVQDKSIQIFDVDSIKDLDKYENISGR